MALDIAELFLGSALATLFPYAVVATWARFNPEMKDPDHDLPPWAR